MAALFRAAGSTLSSIFSAAPVRASPAVVVQQTTTTTGPLLDPIPDFAELGIENDPAAIREELRRGPSVCFHVGPEGTPFDVPARLLQYHSLWFQESFAAVPSRPIALQDHPSLAFAKLLSWLHEGRLGDEHVGLITAATASLSVEGDTGSSTSSTSSNNNDNSSSGSSAEVRAEVAGGTIFQAAQKACTLLCDIHYLADDFAMAGLQADTHVQLTRIAARCAAMNHPTPLAPPTILGIFSRTAARHPLRDLAARELYYAFLTHPALYRLEDWKECFEVCEGLREGVLEGVLEVIGYSWGRLARREEREGHPPALDEGRPAGYWKGPF